MSTVLKARSRGVRALTKRRESVKSATTPYTALDFDHIDTRAQQLADHIEIHFEDLAHILLEYESYEVVVDEISRTLDLLRNLKENRKYFQLRIGEVATFLPRNQPLYALTCFVIIPSFMASAVHFRIPHGMRHFFPKLLALLQIYQNYPNIIVSFSLRAEFLRERTALRVNPKTKESWPVTDAVIFTGTPVHADQLRFLFDRRILFIANGAGHNPVVVSSDADIAKAVAATLTLQLYNQGQDCAAPNSVLVHKKIFPLFLHQLRNGLRATGVGDYRDRQCRVGPISEPKDLVRVQDFLIENRQWLDSTTPGIIRTSTATLEPTIISKPLKAGGNFAEIFAPIIFLQEYDADPDLALYFEDPRYAPNAMYVTLYGTSTYVKKLVGRTVSGKVMHDKNSFLHNTHLHAPGVERGTQPYGGSGYGASSLSINGKIICKATLPQRDLYEWIAKPVARRHAQGMVTMDLRGYKNITYKDIRKLMKIKSSQQALIPDSSGAVDEAMYLDSQILRTSGKRYIRVGADLVFRLLKIPNVEYISSLGPDDQRHIRALRTLLLSKTSIPSDEFQTRLYAFPVEPTMTKEEKQACQLRFFRHVYQLLFGCKSGPRLGQFLIEGDRGHICALLDV